MLTEEQLTASFRKDRSLVRFVCTRFLRTRDDVDDMEALAWLEAWKSRGSYEQRATLRAFVAGVARNQCLEEQRKRRWRKRAALVREEPTEESDPLEHLRDQALAPDELVIQLEERRAAAALLDTLPRRQRRAILLLHAGHARREIARELKVSVKGVGRLLQNGYRRLRSAARSEGHEEARARA